MEIVDEEAEEEEEGEGLLVVAGFPRLLMSLAASVSTFVPRADEEERKEEDIRIYARHGNPSTQKTK